MTATRRAWVRQLMGMPISIHLRGATPDPVRERAVNAAFAAFAEVDRVFSLFRATSVVSQLRAGTRTLADCPPVVAEVLDLCERAYGETDGAFSAWLPGRDGVLRLDPSGLVKGWATERVAAALADAVPADDYYVSAGGDIALAVRGDRPPWRVAVENPLDPGRHLAVLALTAGGVATSGVAHRGAHLVDPVTGAPATALLSATVVGPSLMWADVFATALCVRPTLALPPDYRALTLPA